MHYTLYIILHFTFQNLVAKFSFHNFFNKTAVKLFQNLKKYIMTLIMSHKYISLLRYIVSTRGMAF